MLALLRFYFVFSTLCRSFPFRQLRQNDGEEHEHAADEFPAGELLLRDEQAAEQRRKDRFQAQQQRRDRRLGVLLPDDLKRIGIPCLAGLLILFSD